MSLEPVATPQGLYMSLQEAMYVRKKSCQFHRNSQASIVRLWSLAASHSCPLACLTFLATAVIKSSRRQVLNILPSLSQVQSCCSLFVCIQCSQLKANNVNYDIGVLSKSQMKFGGQSITWIRAVTVIYYSQPLDSILKRTKFGGNINFYDLFALKSFNAFF